MSDALALFRAELRAASARRLTRRRRRRRVVAAVATAAIAVAGSGLAVAMTRGLFEATPAPPEVVENFSLYTPQLGFDPLPEAAELVAADGEFRLYRTPTRQGTYCVTWTAPETPRTLGDGGTCMSKDIAAEPLVASVIGGDSGRALVAGRVQAIGAAVIRLARPDGSIVERPLGADGFFVAAVPVKLCDRDWEPEFVALSAGGAEIARAVISLVEVYPDVGACALAGNFHGPGPLGND